MILLLRTNYGGLKLLQGNFTVQVDGATQKNLTAAANTTSYQQALFSYTFDPSVVSDAHFVSLTALLSASDSWLDVDFVTLTNGVTAP